jgi:hypothetical protein
MCKRIKPYSAKEKLDELNRLELGTKSFEILYDCGAGKALQIKRMVIKKVKESGRILPYPDKVPTAAAIRFLQIDEGRIRRLAKLEQEKGASAGTDAPSR